MIIYFDESYDLNHELLILAALFNPHSRFLHRRLLEEKKRLGFINLDGTTREIKYSNVKGRTKLELAKIAIDIFFESTSWFRCIVIEQALIDINRFGKPMEADSLKKARMYKKFAELLLSHNTKNIYKAVLLTDNLTRCKGDEFVEVMKQEFCVPFGKHSEDSDLPTLRDVLEIESHLDQYQVNQINDILAGCIINNNFPTKRPEKNVLRGHLIRKLGVKDLLGKTWSHYSKTLVEERYPKFNIWYWKPK